ncbi:hypothetical protein GCM10029964_086590 [Kibdelosporangium lantanae]
MPVPERHGLDGSGVQGEFPRTSSGKVRRGALRDRVSTKPDVLATVREVLGADVDDHKPFYELGLTSLTLMRLKAQLEQALGTSIPTTAMFEHPTVAALTAHVTGRSAARPVPPPPPDVDNRIAVIGLSVRFPGAPTIEQFWSNLRDGVDSVQTFDRTDGVIPVGGVLSDVDVFDAEFLPERVGWATTARRTTTTTPCPPPSTPRNSGTSAG